MWAPAEHQSRVNVTLKIFQHFFIKYNLTKKFSIQHQNPKPKIFANHGITVCSDGLAPKNLLFISLRLWVTDLVFSYIIHCLEKSTSPGPSPSNNYGVTGFPTPSNSWVASTKSGAYSFSCAIHMAGIKEYNLHWFNTWNFLPSCLRFCPISTSHILLGSVGSKLNTVSFSSGNNLSPDISAHISVYRAFLCNALCVWHWMCFSRLTPISSAYQLSAVSTKYLPFPTNCVFF